MFIDSSALVAILLGENDKSDLRAKLKASRRYTSAIVIYESTMAIARNTKKPISEAEAVVIGMLRAYRIQIISVDHRHATAALGAFNRFGKGRHRAALNMGDCFSYACAQIQNLPLLFKGDDFTHTEDIKFA